MLPDDRHRTHDNTRGQPAPFCCLRGGGAGRDSLRAAGGDGKRQGETAAGLDGLPELRSRTGAGDVGAMTVQARIDPDENLISMRVCGRLAGAAGKWGQGRGQSGGSGDRESKKNLLPSYFLS